MPKLKSKNHGKFHAYFVIATIKLVGLLPLSFARKLGALLASSSWVFTDRNLRTTLQNLALCYPNMPEDERKQMAKKSVRHTGMLAAEIFVIMRKSQEWINRKVVAVEGEDLLKSELAKGKGLMIMAPHVGNWEFLGQMLLPYGELTVLYQPPKYPYLEPIIKGSRERSGMLTVPTSPKGLVLLLKSLKSGGMTAILPDQNPAWGSGTFVPFFGRPAYTMTMAHGMIRRTESSVLFLVAERVKGGFVVHVRKAPEGIYSENLEESLKALNQGVEECIAICPEQNQWEYKRFNKCPEGVDNPYR